MTTIIHIKNNPKIMITIFMGIIIFLTFIDFFYTIEKLAFFFLLFILGFFQLYSDQWKSQNITGQRLFKRLFYILNVLLFLIILSLGLLGNNILARHFSFSKLTLYYAIEEHHFYEEADISIEQCGIKGLGVVKTKFIQDCCRQDFLLEEKNGEINLVNK